MARNYQWFKGKKYDIRWICHKVITQISTIIQETIYPYDISHRLIPLLIILPFGFFNGAAKLASCGCGAVLRIDISTQFNLHWNGGPSTNTRADAITLCVLLWFAQKKKLHSLHIYGDTKSLIDGILGHSNYNSPKLSGWIKRIKHILGSLTSTKKPTWRKTNCQRMALESTTES